MHQILVLEDDVDLCQLIKEGLADAFTVSALRGVEEAYQYAIANSPAAIVIDLWAGEQSGLDVCKRLRANALTRHIPILLITDDTSAELMNQAYDLGADDYLRKPISVKELEMRLKARIRRFEEIVPKRNKIGSMTLVPERHEIELSGKSHRLSPIEFQLLRVFILNPNRSVSRIELLNSIWQDVAVSNRTVDVHVSTLRRKLAGSEFKIDSIYGAGYILRQSEA